MLQISQGVIFTRRRPDFPRRSPASEFLCWVASRISATTLLDALANDPSNYLDMEFRPGDIQLIHNHVILHDRTDYEDWPEPERKRHLLRLWLCPPNGRPLPAVFADRYGGTEIGNRGGIVLPGVKMATPMEAC
jgi:Taurine catabolism dioxygenase TauD, TfdA family